MIPYFARDSITRVFYAFHDAKTPLMVGLFAIFVKALLNWLLVVHFDFGVGGITLSITLVTFMNMILLGLLSKRHIRDLGFAQMVLPFLKLSLAGLAMAVLLVGGKSLFAGWFSATSSALAEVACIAAISGVGFLGYVLVALLMRVEEARYVYERLAQKLRRGR
jgi:putative peptidoglycan lipid II flippase